MRRFFRWLARIAATALTLLLVIVLLPHASRLFSALLPDLSGAALNTSVLLSHQLESTARLETALVEDEGVLNASTNAIFIGQVQNVSIQYTYRASLGLDLSKVEMKLEDGIITLLLPEVEILSDSLTPTQIEKNDFWYPLTEERRQKLIEDELHRCRERCLADYAASEEAWDSTVSAMEKTVAAWMENAKGVTIRFEKAGTR